MKKSFAGSHPEEQYSPATRKKMFLDRPTSHGGWPEGEYDPPVRDRIYGWYKKMKMMPEGDDLETNDASSSEHRRGAQKGRQGLLSDLQKGKYGYQLGFRSDPESEKLARDLALQIMASDDPENSDAFMYVARHREHVMNVWSELQTSGEYALARMVKKLADEQVDQTGKLKKITESTLREIIREEIGKLS